jgi:uncharacterized protein YPO0396
MAVSLDFMSSQFERLIAELRENKVIADLDRRNARTAQDNVAVETARAIGQMDARLEMAVAHLDERLDMIDTRLDRIEELLRRVTS